MKRMNHHHRVMSRREMLCRCANGFGAVALTSMMVKDAVAQAPRALGSASLDPTPHLTPKAKNVIFIFLSCGMSHIDGPSQRILGVPKWH